MSNPETHKIPSEDFCHKYNYDECLCLTWNTHAWTETCPRTCTCTRARTHTHVHFKWGFLCRMEYLEFLWLIWNAFLSCE